MHRTIRKSVMCIAIAAALYGQNSFAEEVGNVATLVPGKNQVELTTNKGVAIKIELLRSDVFRIWAGPHGKLVDAPNKAAPIVFKTDYPGVDFKLTDAGDHQLLRTDDFALRIYKKPLRFALYKTDNKTLLWQELKPLELDADGSYQTLSTNAAEHFFGGGQQNGNFEFKGKTLEVSYSGGWEEGDRPSPAPFYMSTAGYGVLRNTWSNGSYDFRSDDYVTTKHKEDRFDAYYFVGNSIKEVLADYTELTGRASLLPRWAFEYGDADCYNDGDNIKKPGTVPKGWSDGPTGTTPDVVATVAAKYRENDMPGGWILPNDGYGCGYTKLPEVVQGLKTLGFHTGLWTENGVDKIAWEVGTAGTRVQKLDVAWTGEGYQFALDANMAAANGILQNSDSRPFLWTVMGWAGIQRYAVTWTGDQSGSWDYIRWHVPTLIGSGLSGQTYATGDVDGIFGGSPETYTRDLQWKSFTPVLMGMSGWSAAERKHPWWFNEPYRSINRDYLKLKMRLMPYMYTTAWQAEKTGAPIVRGLMWDHPQDPNAYTENYKNQFFLGQDFLVAPVYSSQVTSRGWRKGIYLPQGEWIDYWDGTVTTADVQGKVIDYPVTLEKLPVLVRAGAIIPMYPTALYDGQVAKDVLTLDIYPHGHSEFNLYEDDGNTRSYKTGAFSQQKFTVDAGTAENPGDITVALGAVEGNYQGLEEQRSYELLLHTRVKPNAVNVGSHTLTEQGSLDDLNKAGSGWYFAKDEKYGVVHIRLAKASVRQAASVHIAIDATTAVAPTKPYPAMPTPGRDIPADQIIVLNRPFEEPGQPLENAFDGNPSTWFRTKRDQSMKTGPHEFVLAFGERKMVSGFEIAPRNDEHWQYGQVRDFEVYMSDKNGEWGKPVYVGRLQRQKERQTVEFPPAIGSLFRFRVLSVHDAEDGAAQDPMVLAAEKTDPANRPYNAFAIDAVPPITISEFHILQPEMPNKPKQILYLSDAHATLSENSRGTVKKDFASPNIKEDHVPLKMNGLTFHKGLGVNDKSRIDYQLSGNWQLFRADIGIDDSCRKNGGASFQVYGDDKLLFNSGLVAAPAVVKPELDMRGIHKLSLRVTGANNTICANWTNAMLIGFEGDTVGK
jgi:alpha-glucosidase (family GH31 glycosyl hydrolase)